MKVPASTPAAAAEDAIREAAARWHDRWSQEPVSAETRAAFTQWLEQSAAHREAYDAAKSAWMLAQRGAHDPQMLALRHETALRITRRSARKVHISNWAAAAMVCLFIGGLLLAGLMPQVAPQVNAMLASFGIANDGKYLTKVGERLVVNLKDGSQVTLNTNSAMQVTFTPGERHLRLIRGQALFEVAKDRARPFVVEANGRRLVAVGTAFDVRVDGKRMQVTMLEGVVRVERAIANAVAAEGEVAGSVIHPKEVAQIIATLSAGEQLTMNDLRLDRIRIADPDRETSWRRGQLLFENTRLADALIEMNRYSDTQLELADDTLADLRISGAFSTSRPKVFVEALTTYFPIDVDQADEQKLTLSKRERTSATQ